MTQARRTVLAVAAALLLMLWAAPSPTEALQTLRDAAGQTDPTAPLLAVVALLAWALGLWLAATVVLTVGGRAPGRLGRAASALVGRCAPVTVRRTVEVALGLTVAVGVLGASPAAATPGPPATQDAAAVGASAFDLDWPEQPPPSAPRPPQPSADLPPAAAADRTPTSTAGAVVVQAGDTLWSLADHALRRADGGRPTAGQVASAWPQWWAANRDVIGDDPDLLLPGTSLVPPR